MITIKTKEEVELMRHAGKIAYKILNDLKKVIVPGMTTEEIDKYVYNVIVENDSTPTFLNYDGFPASACISLNEVVVHGIPNKSKVKNGDIISVDIGVNYKGMNVDTAYTYILGDVNKKITNLVNETQRALYEGIKVIKPGISLNDVCSSIEKVAKTNKFGIIKQLTGHGVGKELHEDPYIPNYSNDESKGIILKEGMTLAIEPMFSLGTNKIYMDEDGWAIYTADYSKTAHFEHTVLVTKDGYEIITGE